MVERTLALIKPHGVGMGITQEVKQRYLDAGLRIVQERLQIMEDGATCAFYKEHTGKFFFETLVTSMTSGPSLALLLEGEDAIKIVRQLNGSTDPTKADPGTIRHDFKSNVVHGSDSPEAVEHEAGIVFQER